MEETVIKIEDLKKRYNLGTIGGGTLAADLQSWWAKKRGKEDPNSIIGDTRNSNEEFYALKGINLEVHKGDTLGIIGSNGAGKSTLLKLLSRVTAPTEGTIKIKGRISSMLEVGTGFHAELTGRENIYLNGAILGMSRTEVDQKINDIIEFSECAQFIDTPVKRYSSGMYVKLAFAVASHLDSEILIMDEVLAVGDMTFQKKCLDKMSTIADKDKRTILYVSHNMNTIRRLCKRCIVLDKGKIIYDGNTEEAIQIYLHCNTDDLNDHLDLDKRTRYEHSENTARMLRADLLNTENGTLEQGNNLKFKLTWRANIDLDKVRIRAQIGDSGVMLGCAVSEPVVDAKAGKEYVSTIELFTEILTPGRYYVNLTIYQCDDRGNNNVIDNIPMTIMLQINEGTLKNPFVWNKEWYGSMRFPDLIISNDGE